MLGFGTQLITVCLLMVGILPYGLWTAARHPSRQARWAVTGLYTAVVGYAGAVAYGFAFTDPVGVCGWRTLDNDFPLVHVTVDAFPPDVTCYWSDRPSHATALSAWVMWVGLAIAVVTFSVILLRRESRASRVARAGAMWSPMVASLIWVTGIDPMMELSRTDLRDECLHWKTVPPETKLTHIEVLDVGTTTFPPSITCTYSDGEANLLADEWTAVLLCGVVFAVFAGTVLYEVATAGRLRSVREEPTG
ncbi:hypothetical protein ACFY2M_33735 [Streptomyces sp. NPDC001276]|uniref:hypothetical protein n=1 Tax=Streptomyces sp. NPDC001276 TaxID=3364555 RepID=UPI0036C2B5E8